jgi:hypothetical protein
MQLKKLDIYVFAFVTTQNGVSMPLIGLCHINANPIWIFVHNIILTLVSTLVKM